MHFILIFTVVVVAFWISAICGGGASLVLIPLLSLSMAASEVPAALTIGTFSSSASRLAVFKKHIHWRIVLFYVPAGIPAVWLGAWALKYVNPIYLQFGIGVFLLINVRYLLLPDKKIRTHEKPTSQLTLLAIGATAGFVSGLTGAVGLLFNRFYLQYGLSKEEIVATRAANDILIHFVKLVLYSSMGLLTSNTIFVGVVIAVGAVLSSVTIRYILPYLNEVVFRRIGYGAMAISGALLLVSTSNSIVSANQIDIQLKPISNSIETQIAWRKSHFAIEFEYDEGIQIEQEITFNELPENLQTKVLELTKNAHTIIYERVLGFNSISYEVYFTKNNRAEKFEFHE